VVAKVREILAVSKQAAQKFDVERCHLKGLSELEIREQYKINISNRFTALETLNDSKDINSAWENIKENTRPQLESLCLHEFKQHKPWFDKECLCFSDQRKQDKME